MSGAVVIIIVSDPDDATKRPAPIAPVETKDRVTIPFSDDDSPVEVGHRVAQALSKLRRG